MGRGNAKKTAIYYDKRRGGKVVYQGKTKKPEKQALSLAFKILPPLRTILISSPFFMHSVSGLFSLPI